MTALSSSTLLPSSVRDAFAPTVTYLNTASCGLLPTTVLAAVTAADQRRASGEFDIPGVDAAIATSRAAYGRLVGTDADHVAIGTQVSQLVGLIAESLPEGANVLVPEGEFNSVLWPFLARPDLNVRTVPLRELADAIRPGDALVAASVVQSADGSVLDMPEVVGAAHAHGARVLFDLSQAAGWLPVHDTGADWLVCGGYKFLLGPKGSAFLSATDEAFDSLRPIGASWYSGFDPWQTCYDGPLRQADNARRFDLSPVWPSWIGHVPAFELLESVGIEAIHRHNVALANRLRAGLGLAPGNSAIVSFEAAPEAAARLRAAKVIGAMRAGRLRLAVHLNNTEADIDRALDALAG
ncbi:aminotransferase class V-fold PLP-dependent enzyme [Nocardia sp. NPDC051030]|uniref:aminotransferase class V-fold PLP-dependent enzyme n=1 Tax=Nocardia sp. NPDC051030 TaxID=3155162 RepID=UPI0034355EF4